MLLDFELDPKIIHHIIFNQAGSMGKALLELVMNCVDAGAKSVRLIVSGTSFSCSDDGTGFATEEDVLRYFGRFGTPHIEGDATYGRFRLGRGQIMAYAKTIWESNYWKMEVDTAKWGYKYELNSLDERRSGCHISGEWYEPLSDMELLSTCQEIRDLIRYTPVEVELNGKVISKNPANEKWDAEDEFAYYRVKAEGAVSIYNQGVLVRHDSGHVWGAGGMIVSKKAIDLNVSRTEILRKTCQVWKPIAAAFQKLANKYVSELGDRRKTEARREKAARSLLAGDPDIFKIFHREEVITVLPGKRHVTLDQFMRICQYSYACQTTVLVNEADMPKGEALVHAGVTQVIHSATLDRFGCHTVSEFKEALERISENLVASGNQGRRGRSLPVIKFMDFQTLKEAYVERTRLVHAKDALDKETRRLWTALAWCLTQYAGLATGGCDRFYGGRTTGGKIKSIFIGQSDTADAWTDGSSYIAINEKIVQRLKSEPMQVASHIFALVDHEICHEGDSMESGHDEAFYQRFHDHVLEFSEKRQWYLRLFLRKYVTSLEGESKRLKGSAYRDVWLENRAGNGRKEKGLPSAYGDSLLAESDLHAQHSEDSNLINLVNTTLERFDSAEMKVDWDKVKALAIQVANEHEINRKALEADMDAQCDAWEAEMEAVWAEEARSWVESLDLWSVRLSQEFQVEVKDLPFELIEYFADTYSKVEDCSDQDLRLQLTRFEYVKQFICLKYKRPMEAVTFDAILDAYLRGFESDGLDDWERESAGYDSMLNDAVSGDDPDSDTWMDRYGISPENQHLVCEGETEWSLERNAAAAGFYRIEDYLVWRKGD